MDLPREDALRWIVARYAGLRARHGEALGDPELLEPTGRHFPDPFAPDAPSVARLLHRMMSYAPISDELDVRLRFVDADAGAEAKGGCGTGGGAGGCGTGACAPQAGAGPKDRVLELEDGYLVELPVADVGHPLMLTTSLARSVGGLVLLEGDEDVDAANFGATSEVAGVAAGFGLLLTGGAYIYGKSCGGVRTHQHTHLSVEEHAVLLALFAKLQGVRPGVVRAHLEATQREAYAEAKAWVDSNMTLTGLLRDHPERLVDGIFEIEPVKGLLGRLFVGSREQKMDIEPNSVRPRSKRSQEEERRLAEAKALVEEALREG